MASTAGTRATIGDIVLLVGAMLLVATVPFSNALSQVGTVVMIAGCAAVLWADRTAVPRVLVLAIAGWLAACLVSAGFSSDPALSTRALLRKVLEYELLCLAAAVLARHPRQLARILTICAWTGVVISLDAWLQGMLGHDLLRSRPLSEGRLTGPFTNPNNLASYLLIVIPLQVWRATKGRWWERAGLAASLLLEIAVLLRADARASWLTLIGALAVMLVVSRRVALAGYLGALVMAGLWRWNGLEAVSGARQWLDPGRLEGWQIAWRMFTDHPVVGIGLGTFMANYAGYVTGPGGDWARPQYAHNCYLQMLAETGVVGLAAFLLLLALGARAAALVLWQGREDEAALMTGLLSALVACLINMGFDTGFYSLPIVTLFWLLLGLTVGAGACTETRCSSAS